MLRFKFNDPLILTECSVAIALTLLAVFLHAFFLINAGGFWRDEVNSISLALMPGLIDTWSALKFDIHPALHILIVKIWAKLFGHNDMSLRTLGFTVGVLIVAALWFNSWVHGNRPPLISLLLIGTSPVMIRSLDSARPYGVVVLATILAFTVVWRAVQKSGAVRLITASFMLVLCIQTLYQSAVFVLAIGIGAITVAFLRGGLKQASLLAIPFFLAAISLLLNMSHLQEAIGWWPLAKNPLETGSALSALIDAISSPTKWFMFLWAAVVVVAIIGVIQNLVRNRFTYNREEVQGYFFLYCGITFISSIVCFVLFFLFMVGPISLQAWYYVPLLVVIVVSAEPLVDQLTLKKFRRALFLLAIAVSSITALVPAKQNLTMRMTSMDLVASFIEREARPDDLVIINPWYLGISFNRYYQGGAPWVTFPALQDNTIHRHDLVKERMTNPESISEDIRRITSTMQQGGRIWVIGQVGSLKPRPVVTPLQPAPLPKTGWSSAPYLENWNNHLMNVLLTHAREVAIVPVSSRYKINPLEAPQVVIFRGWMP